MSKTPDIDSVPMLSVWLKELERRVDQSELGVDTAANYRNHFRKFVTWLWNECEGDTAAIQRELKDSEGIKLGQYLTKIFASYKPSAMRTHLCSLRQAFKWLHEQHSATSPDLVKKPLLDDGANDLHGVEVGKSAEPLVSSVDLEVESGNSEDISESLVALVDLWIRGMSGAEQERDVLNRYLCFVDSSIEIETDLDDEIKAFRFILELSKRGVLSRFIDNEDEMPDWVLYSRVGYILLSPKDVLPGLIAEVIAAEESFEHYHNVLLRFYDWARRKGATPFGESAVSDIVTEAWADCNS